MKGAGIYAYFEGGSQLAVNLLGWKLQVSSCRLMGAARRMQRRD